MKLERKSGIKMVYDLIIIGAGPAGLSAAIYAKRNGLKTLLIDKEMIGGALNYSSEIENYLGFKKLTGVELARHFKEHIESLEVEYLNKAVIEIKDLGTLKKVITKDSEYETKRVLIASGRKPLPLGLDGEIELYGKGISRCAVCDGPFFKGRDVAIVGAGNSALEESIFLSNIVNKVYLLVRGDRLKGEILLQEQVKGKENIEIIYNVNLKELKSDGSKLIGGVLDNGLELTFEGLFIYIGYAPALDFIKDIKTSEDGYLIVDGNHETSVEGIYAAGDITKNDYYQIVVAASEGAEAALRISESLRSDE